jgi:transcription elongation GreA/GreB family factor
MNNVLTKSGSTRLQARLNTLKTFDLAQAREELIRSREDGRLEENEGYLHAQEQCRIIERRVSELAEILSTYEVTEEIPPTGYIGFGSTATIEDVDDEKRRTVTLVGEPEADFSLGLVSVTSPLGEALLGAKVGDVVDVVLPRGNVQYEILNIGV